MSLAKERSTVLLAKQQCALTRKMYMVQNYFIFCAECVNECMYMYLRAQNVHFYGGDQLRVQYSLFGVTVPLIKGTEVSRTVPVLSESQTRVVWYLHCEHCGKIFLKPAQGIEKCYGKGEVSLALSYTGFKRLFLNFRRSRWKQFWDCLKSKF